MVFEDELFSRVCVQGAMVAALPDLELLEERVLGLRRLLDKDNGLGDERAEWQKDDEGVWYK